MGFRAGRPTYPRAGIGFLRGFMGFPAGLRVPTQVDYESEGRRFESCRARSRKCCKSQNIKYTGAQVVLFEGDKIHVIVLEDVKGDKVTIDYGGLATDFDKVAPEGQKLVESVKWGGP